MLGCQGYAYAQLQSAGSGNARAHEGLVLLLITAVIGQAGVAGELGYLLVNKALLVKAVSHALLRDVGVYRQVLQHEVTAEPDLLVGKAWVGLDEVAVGAAGPKEGRVGQSSGGAGAGGVALGYCGGYGLVARLVGGAVGGAPAAHGFATAEPAIYVVVHPRQHYGVSPTGANFIGEVDAAVAQRSARGAHGACCQYFARAIVGADACI